ncbi:hypothetical protein GHK92_18905 [Nocardioides sp. dk4132]|uniref:hypothetical protein n=1 Tax=unclassified Nocardioides TaxID=2615069 RepID=UPI0012952C52|nr:MULTISPECIES: hypothetical protein [unclassified Nocardioides]MQW77942.1 hypothetical protein [Nocardioides sp. dk4132]
MRQRLAPLLLPALLTGTLAAVLVGCGSDSEDQAPTVPVSDSATATPTSPAPGTPSVSPSESPSTTTSTSASATPTEPTAPATPSTSAPATSAPATTAPVATPTAPAAQPPAVDTDLRVAVTAYHVAFTTGDAPAAFELLSERCKDTVDMGAFGEESLAQAAKHGTTPRLTSYDAESGSDRASVTASFRGPRITLAAEPWVRELGAWHRDVC